MTIEQIIENVNEIDIDNEYWFVRTDSGQYYETYTTNGFIGIGWNYITLSDLRNMSVDDIKNKIARREKLSLEDPSERGKVTMIYNKLDRFYKLKKGDRVMIPSRNSDFYSFGVVTSSRMILDENQSYDCEYYKRHKIKWIVSAPMSNLDPIFYKIRMSRHAISSVKDYSNRIDKVMDSLFIKNGNSHLVLEITKQSDINLNSIVTLTSEIQALLKVINDHFGLDENINESYIKLNLQSRGTIEFILKKGRSLLILAAVLGLTSIGNDTQTRGSNSPSDTDTKLFIEQNKPALDSINRTMDELQVDRQKINSDI